MNPAVVFPTVVEINVGGVVFSVSAALLQLAPGCLGSIFSGVTVPACVDHKARVFFEADGDIFHHVLRFLRSGCRPLHFTGADKKERLLQQLQYFGIDVPTRAPVVFVLLQNTLCALDPQTLRPVENYVHGLPTDVRNKTVDTITFVDDRLIVYLCDTAPGVGVDVVTAVYEFQVLSKTWTKVKPCGSVPYVLPDDSLAAPAFVKDGLFVKPCGGIGTTFGSGAGIPVEHAPHTVKTMIKHLTCHASVASVVGKGLYIYLFETTERRCAFYLYNAPAGHKWTVLPIPDNTCKGYCRLLATETHVLAIVNGRVPFAFCCASCEWTDKPHLILPTTGARPETKGRPDWMRACRVQDFLLITDPDSTYAMKVDCCASNATRVDFLPGVRAACSGNIVSPLYDT